MKPSGFVLLLTFLLFLPSSSVLSQDAPKVLFGNNENKISGFGAMIIEFSGVDGNATIFNGGGGAAIFNRSFYAGGYGLRLANDLGATYAGDRWSTELFQGGLWLGYLIHPHRMVHFGLSSRLGWGNLRIFPENGAISSAPPVSDILFVWTPQAEVEMNISYWMKVNAAAGYRWASGLENQFFTDRELSSPGLTLSVLFGWFK